MHEVSKNLFPPLYIIYIYMYIFLVSAELNIMQYLLGTKNVNKNQTLLKIRHRKQSKESADTTCIVMVQYRFISQTLIVIVQIAASSLIRVASCKCEPVRGGT